MSPLHTLDRNSDEHASARRLAQVLAHRLGGLVTGIEGFTDLLADSLATPDQRELALKIMEGASRMESILTDLQRYGEPLKPVMLPVRTHEVLDDLLIPLPDDDRARIEVDEYVDGPTGMLTADPFQLRQALLALLQNALEATRRNARVRMEVSRREDAVCFEVWNEGTIALDHAEEIVFIPFFTTKVHNLGVGLSIARRIAWNHHGTLELTSNSVKEGTRFCLRIPH